MNYNDNSTVISTFVTTYNCTLLFRPQGVITQRDFIIYEP